ncbi:unnamed protein product [Nesidiocoris tenuis]|uniref:Uncharacterized protein n=1 Tax=Nesidiocoris tenuis TaxID=355587 RepID=A0A6H5HDJ9_9HEMI|nr:unnamed protein product [Nesidiocoris tenuis]
MTLVINSLEQQEDGHYELDQRKHGGHVILKAPMELDGHQLSLPDGFSPKFQLLFQISIIIFIFKLFCLSNIVLQRGAVTLALLGPTPNIRPYSPEHSSILGISRILTRNPHTLAVLALDPEHRRILSTNDEVQQSTQIYHRTRPIAGKEAYSRVHNTPPNKIRQPIQLYPQRSYRALLLFWGSCLPKRDISSVSFVLKTMACSQELWRLVIITLMYPPRTRCNNKILMLTSLVKKELCESCYPTLEKIAYPGSAISTCVRDDDVQIVRLVVRAGRICLYGAGDRRIGEMED